MKAVGFFCAVFFSMLLVFLLATGEFGRWFSRDDGSGRYKIDFSTDSSEPAKNKIYFDFYNVDLGRRSFSISAEFRQEDFQVETQIENIRQLVFRNGLIEVPVAEETEESAKATPTAGADGPGEATPPGGEKGSTETRVSQAPDGEKGSPKTPTGSPKTPTGAGLLKNVILTFENATYQRIEGPGKRKGQFQVLLRNGKGTTNDGTEFAFEELVFSDDVPSGSAQAARTADGRFLLRSTKPVIVRNPSLEMVSPGGFESVLKSHGLETFTFFPPVSAVLDPNRPAFFKVNQEGTGAEDSVRSGQAHPKAEAGAVVGSGGAETKVEDRVATVAKTEPQQGLEQAPNAAAGGADAGTAGTGDTRIAVTCQGPLSLVFQERARDSVPPGPSKTLVKFQKDVVLYAVKAPIDVKSLPEPQGNRFECQELELELESSGQQLLPRRAVATSPGGRVRALLYRETGGPPITIDGDRLEWLLEVNPEAAGTPKAADDSVRQRLGSAAQSEAVLYGQPTLRGQNLSFVAERGVFRLSESRVRLDSVKGTVDYVVSRSKEVHKAGKAEGPGWTPPRIDPWEGEPPQPVEKGAPQPGGAKESSSALSNRWDMKADEVEFFFRSFVGSGSPGSVGQELTRFEARSKGADGVEIRSQAPAGESGVTADGKSSPSIQVRGKVLTYVEAEKKFTLEGIPDAKPRLSKGENWIEAQRIHILVEEGLAWFDGAVQGRIESQRTLALKSEDSTPLKESPASVREEKEEASLAFDIQASSLTVRKLADRSIIRDIWGKGTMDLPVSVTSISTPRFRLLGPEIYWDQERQVAQLMGPPAGAGTPAQDAQLAKVEFENGELNADRIQFDQKQWKAYLSDRVSIHIFREGQSPTGDNARDSQVLEVNTAKATVEFFPNFAQTGPQADGPLRQLSRVKALHALSVPGRPIEIRGTTFAARAEECTWDSSTRELRFFGSGFQEIEILHEDFHGPTRAREIIYAEDKRLVTLRGEVQGKIVQSSLPTSISGDVPAARVAPAAQRPGSEQDPMVWQFDTAQLEIQLRQVAGHSKLELDSLRARDKVHLRNDVLRVQLRGDDLTYEDATRKLHVFSLDGRPQTILCDRLEKLGEGKPPAEPQGPQTQGEKVDSGMEKAHKIVAQEIWLLFYENAHATPQRGEPREWLLVEFSRDVMASFYLPAAEGQAGKAGDAHLGDTWKLVAEKLTLHIDPTQPAGEGSNRSLRGLIPWAVASGKVVFSSGVYQATADRAIYEDPFSRVTLIGSPARLSQENKTVEESPEIQIRKVGNVIEYSPAGRQSRPVVPEFPKLPQ